MLLLKSTDTLEVITGTTGIDLDVHVDYVDLVTATSVITPDRPANINILTNTTTVICTAPAAGTVRNVKNISIANEGAVTTTVTIQHNDGTYAAELWGASLAAGESVNLDDLGNWSYLDSAGQVKVNQAIPATAWTAPGTIGSVTPNTGAFTTLTASGAVTLSPANVAVAISPSGTGTVAISPVGALTINPTAASTINNASIGATTRSTGAFSLVGAGGASAAAAYITTAAGTTSVAPAMFTGGTNLTTAAAGAFENDAIAPYFTTNTSDGRGHIPTRQHFRLTANGAAFNTISNFFGTTSNIVLVASAYYMIEVVLLFTKTTAETVTVTLTNSAAPTSQNISWEQSPITGIVAPPGSATDLFGIIAGGTTAATAITTGSLTTGVTHWIRMRIDLKNGTGTSLKIQAACTTASGITPLLGSYWTSTRLPTGNTGAFAA